MTDTKNTLPEIVVQSGRGGLNSRGKIDKIVIVVTCGTMSRSGRAMGNVDEGVCAHVAAFAPQDEYGGRNVLASLRIYTPDRYDATARNKIGTLGAYVETQPSAAQVERAVETVRAAVERGERLFEIRALGAA